MKYIVLVVLPNYLSRVVVLQVTLRENIGDVFKIRVGLAELPDTAQYWTLDSVRPHVASCDIKYYNFYALTSLTLRNTETLSTNYVGMFDSVCPHINIKSCLKITYSFRNYFPTSVILISKHLLFILVTSDCAVLLSVVCVYRWE